jgi:hypothetical protein
MEGGIEGGDVQPVDEIVHGMFEGAGNELLLKADGKE